MEIFQYEFAIRALIASGLVGILCGVLGCFIILRHMALIGDALAHAILPGVVVGFLIAGYSLTGFFSGAVVAGLVAAVLITWIQQNLKTKEDAAIGIVFTAMFASGIMAISWLSRSEGVHLDMQDFLFGNVLAISDMDLVLTAIITIFVTGSILVFYRYFFVTTFQSVVSRTMGISVNLMHYFLMMLLSFSVVASIQTVGVILVVAMLIIPASTAYLISNRLQYMIAWSAAFGLFSTVSGLMVAILFETTPGPAMTVMAALFYFIVAMVAPQNGYLVRKLSNLRRQNHIRQEDVLKLTERLSETNSLSREKLLELSGLNIKQLNNQLKRLARNGFIELKHNDDIVLTQKGKDRAYELIRAHRLWETYLTDKLGVPEAGIHEHAEKYEHMLPKDMVEDIDKDLGHPETDPHGSPIPRRSPGIITLDQLKVNSKCRLSAEQDHDTTVKELWKLGLQPNAEMELFRKDENYFEVRFNGYSVRLPIELAEKVKVEKVNS